VILADLVVQFVAFLVVLVRFLVRLTMKFEPQLAVRFPGIYTIPAPFCIWYLISTPSPGNNVRSSVSTLYTFDCAVYTPAAASTGAAAVRDAFAG
jgi:hypothetical protein